MTEELAFADGEAGFTLIELLVSIVLLAMLTAALFGGLRLGTRAWERAALSTSEIAQIRTAQMSLNEVLSRAYPLILREAGQDAHADFSGDATSITLLTSAPSDVAPGGLARMTLRIDQDTSGVSLVSFTRPELALSDNARRRTILRHVRTLSFSYFGPDDAGQTGRWASTWEGKTRLPSLIRIDATLEGRNAPYWPTMFVRPRITADAACSFDPLTKSCRGY